MSFAVEQCQCLACLYPQHRPQVVRGIALDDGGGRMESGRID
jgi:hypothetical protein